MAGLQTRTYTLAGSSLTAGTFTSISQLLGSSQSTTNPEGMTKVVRISMSCSPDHTSATDGCSVLNLRETVYQYNRSLQDPPGLIRRLAPWTETTVCQ